MSPSKQTIIPLKRIFISHYAKYSISPITVELLISQGFSHFLLTLTVKYDVSLELMNYSKVAVCFLICAKGNSWTPLLITAQAVDAS